jgi:SAM-dependent methyltransferase
MTPSEASLSLTLVCPADREPLVSDRDASSFDCPRCNQSYPVENGVVRFLPGVDDFYEGRFVGASGFVPRDESFLRAWPLWQMRSGWLWAIRAQLPAGSTVVELGCASGVAYFAHRYRMIGLDLSHSSLEMVAGLYDICLQANTTSIPLPDESVDGVISSYFWEHIPPNEKLAALEEYLRILRTGGKLVFLYDVENESPIYRWMKRRDLDLYRDVLIDREGHAGWETPEENRTQFEKAGLRVLEHTGKEKLLISAAMYDKVRQFGGWVRPFAELGYRLSKGPQFYLYNALIRVLDETLCRLLPESWSRVMVSVCEKR